MIFDELADDLEARLQDDEKECSEPPSPSALRNIQRRIVLADKFLLDIQLGEPAALAFVERRAALLASVGLLQCVADEDSDESDLIDTSVKCAQALHLALLSAPPARRGAIAAILFDARLLDSTFAVDVTSPSLENTIHPSLLHASNGKTVTAASLLRLHQSAILEGIFQATWTSCVETRDGAANPTDAGAILFTQQVAAFVAAKSFAGEALDDLLPKILVVSPIASRTIVENLEQLIYQPASSTLLLVRLVSALIEAIEDVAKSTAPPPSVQGEAAAPLFLLLSNNTFLRTVFRILWSDEARDSLNNKSEDVHLRARGCRFLVGLILWGRVRMDILGKDASKHTLSRLLLDKDPSDGQQLISRVMQIFSEGPPKSQNPAELFARREEAICGVKMLMLLILCVNEGEKSEIDRSLFCFISRFVAGEAASFSILHDALLDLLYILSSKNASSLSFETRKQLALDIMDVPNMILCLAENEESKDYADRFALAVLDFLSIADISAEFLNFCRELAGRLHNEIAQGRSNPVNECPGGGQREKKLELSETAADPLDTEGHSSARLAKTIASFLSNSTSRVTVVFRETERNEPSELNKHHIPWITDSEVSKAEPSASQEATAPLDLFALQDAQSSPDAPGPLGYQPLNLFNFTDSP